MRRNGLDRIFFSFEIINIKSLQKTFFFYGRSKPVLLHYLEGLRFRIAIISSNPSKQAKSVT